MYPNFFKYLLCLKEAGLLPNFSLYFVCTHLQILFSHICLVIFFVVVDPKMIRPVTQKP